jgi:hypothetical protein
MADLHIGTSAFTAAGWEGTFYPAGMKPADFLSYYATKFDAVEVDSKFYPTPATSTQASLRLEVHAAQKVLEARVRAHQFSSCSLHSLHSRIHGTASSRALEIARLQTT